MGRQFRMLEKRQRKHGFERKVGGLVRAMSLFCGPCERDYEAFIRTPEYSGMNNYKFR